MALSRRDFIKTAGAFAGGIWLQGCGQPAEAGVHVHAHLWVYASRFPPDWNCTPILDEVFSEIKAAGYAGVEIMEPILLQEGSVDRLKKLSAQYELPVTGTSFYGDMWNRDEQEFILQNMETVAERLQQVGGSMIGLSSGDAGRLKTEDELDVQAGTLKKIMEICSRHKIQPNLHNHTYELMGDMHDLKGTMQRVPELGLGPDIQWLFRGEIDPVWFINTYGHKIVYLHIRDQAANGKFAEAVGDGVIDFPAIAAALQKINYAGNAAVELAFEEPNARPVAENWEISRAYVKKVFGW